jgi:hypothetical protein
MKYAKAMAKAPQKSSRKRASPSTATPTKAESKSQNRSLGAAKKAKQDEFYTQYVDIQKEVEAYLEFNPDTFHDKIVYCNCDDPFESSFFKYFAANFNKLGLKRLICTSYDGSPLAGQMTLFDEYNAGNGHRKKPKAIAVIVDHVKDENNDGAVDIEDVKVFLKKNKANRIALKGNDQYPGGDFRSPECVAFLNQADIVVTNPPFSLFREYVAQLVEYEKKFLIVGNQNAISYKEIFKLIKENVVWLGNKSGDMAFRVPAHYEPRETRYWKDDDGQKWRSMGNACWFTNLDHGRRHQELPLMSVSENLKFSRNLKGKKGYERYDNYDAIEVPSYKEIPSDFDGAMGVPITFLDKYNPEQFEILGNDDFGYPATKTYGSKKKVVNGKVSKSNTGALRCLLRADSFGPGIYFDVGYPVRGVYRRIFIRHRRPANGKK